MATALMQPPLNNPPPPPPPSDQEPSAEPPLPSEAPPYSVPQGSALAEQQYAAPAHSASAPAYPQYDPYARAPPAGQYAQPYPSYPVHPYDPYRQPASWQAGPYAYARPHHAYPSQPQYAHQYYSQPPAQAQYAPAQPAYAPSQPAYGPGYAAGPSAEAARPPADPSRPGISFALHPQPAPAPRPLAPPAPLARPVGVSSAQGVSAVQSGRRQFSDAPPAAGPGTLQPAASNAPGNHVAAGSPPSAFQEWVQRSNRSVPLHRRTEMRAKIKEILSPLVERNTWASHDWDREPIPTLDDSPVSSDDIVGDRRGFGRRRPSPDSPDSSSASPPLKRHAYAPRVHSQTAAKKSKKGKGQQGKSKKGGKSDKWVRGAASAAPMPSSVDSFAVSARAARFRAAAGPAEARVDDDDDDWHAAGVIVQGRCQELEKEFLRLNGPADPAKVRPEPVIRAALDRLIAMIARSEQPYRYHWTQLKAMRQDLIVQHLQTETAAAVEEVFARRALEHGDMRDYQKCSTALRVLFDAGVQGSRAEFDGYRILANVCQDHCTADEVLKAIKDAVAHGVGDSSEVKHALAVQRALDLGNWRGFWRLYGRVPHRGRLIMDRAVPAVRLAAARGLVARCKPAASDDACVTMLGFDVSPPFCEGAPILPGCCEEVRAQEARVLSDCEQRASCRTCLLQFKAVVADLGDGRWELRAKENNSQQLVLPEKEDHKGHGHSDVSLADFQKKGAGAT